MQFMILRKADAGSEAGVGAESELAAALERYRQQLASAGILRGGASLLPSARGVRLALSEQGESVVPGPFSAIRELLDGFLIIDVPSRQDAIDWVSRWPPIDGGGELELEIRETGCPGGCAEIKPADDRPEPAGHQRFAVLLRSDYELETGEPPGQHQLDTLDRSNALAAKAGVLLAADGLQPSARGARVKFAGGKPYAVDGPFTEIKEMIAGYWLIRVASMDDAIAWARQNPYPTGPGVEVEIRPVREVH